MNKKGFLITYYVGLTIGIGLANYMLMHHIGIGEMILKTFQEMDKLQYIDRKELFLYLFLKREKQLLFFCFVYFQISRKIALVGTNLYYAFLEGMILSFSTYYYGVKGMLGCGLLLLPLLLFFFLLQWLGWKLCEEENIVKKITDKRLIISLIVILIIVLVLELTVNMAISPSLFTDRISISV